MKSYAVFAVTAEGGVPEIAGGALPAAACTVMENDGRLLLADPSETVMTIPLYVPTCALLGTPLMRPLSVSKVAQTGSPVTENVSGSLSASEAVGAKK